MTRIGLLVFALAALATSCLYEEPCDQYVEYICDCHAGEPGFDCEELQRALSGADPDVQDQCAIDLAAQEREDDETGHVCDAGDTGF